MVGIRSKKKELTRNKILKASRELFLEKGYEATTTEEIAERAEIGVGTVYNYYKSKSDIFVAAISEEFETDDENTFEDITDLGKGVSDVVYNFIYNHIKKVNVFGKGILRELILASLNSFKSNPSFLYNLIQLDFKIMDKLHDILEELKEKGCLKKNLNSKEVVELIYGALMYEFMLYIYREDISFDDCCEGIKSKIDLIFSNKM